MALTGRKGAPPESPLGPCGVHRSAQFKAMLSGLHDTYTSRRNRVSARSACKTFLCRPARGGSTTATTSSYSYSRDASAFSSTPASTRAVCVSGSAFSSSSPPLSSAFAALGATCGNKMGGAGLTSDACLFRISGNLSSARPATHSQLVTPLSAAFAAASSMAASTISTPTTFFARDASVSPMVPVPQHTSRSRDAPVGLAHSPASRYSASAAQVFTWKNALAESVNRKPQSSSWITHSLGSVPAPVRKSRSGASAGAALAHPSCTCASKRVSGN
mmetsp:Transcript_6204/g.25122  ORF Transcript_6204/g.25122 Transcript_6204/m.25122 type:complete len:275 (+) Transcript_6204:713-1537(+)